MCLSALTQCDVGEVIVCEIELSVQFERMSFPTPALPVCVLSVCVAVRLFWNVYTVFVYCFFFFFLRQQEMTSEGVREIDGSLRKAQYRHLCVCVSVGMCVCVTGSICDFVCLHICVCVFVIVDEQLHMCLCVCVYVCVHVP